MKVNEVRFNNWVNFKFKGVDYGNVMIDKNYFSHYENKDYEYTPIPLTEEWLVKFGYVKDGNNWQGKYHRINELSKGLFTCDKNGIVLIHVHQLQNLYFALTNGKELTI